MGTKVSWWLQPESSREKAQVLPHARLLSEPALQRKDGATTPECTLTTSAPFVAGKDHWQRLIQATAGLRPVSHSANL